MRRGKESWADAGWLFRYYNHPTLLGVGQREKKRNLSWRDGRPGRRKSLGREEVQ